MPKFLRHAITSADHDTDGKGDQESRGREKMISNTSEPRWHCVQHDTWVFRQLEIFTLWPHPPTTTRAPATNKVAEGGREWERKHVFLPRYLAHHVWVQRAWKRYISRYSFSPASPKNMNHKNGESRAGIRPGTRLAFIGAPFTIFRFRELGGSEELREWGRGVGWGRAGVSSSRLGTGESTVAGRSRSLRDSCCVCEDFIGEKWVACCSCHRWRPVKRADSIGLKSSRIMYLKYNGFAYRVFIKHLSIPTMLKIWVNSNKNYLKKKIFVVKGEVESRMSSV